jgi:hypothetical protein
LVASRRTKIIVGVAAVALLFVGYAAGFLTPRQSTPGTDSVEAGFARDMAEHHAQAVEMGMIAYQKASTPEVRSLGGDIAITQQGQIGVMNTWLKDWGLSPNSDKPPMSWMPDGQRALDGNLMPGMATRDEITKLKSRQAGMFTGLTVPATGSTGPAEPMPTDDSRLDPRIDATWSSSPRRASATTPASRVDGVGTAARDRIEPSASTSAAANLLPPTSTASTVPAIRVRRKRPG